MKTNLIRYMIERGGGCCTVLYSGGVYSRYEEEVVEERCTVEIVPVLESVYPRQWSE